MKKTSKVISIILSVFMLMQVMTGVVFASGNTKLNSPTNVRLIYSDEYEDYVYTFDVDIPDELSDSVRYGMCIGGYVDGKAVLCGSDLGRDTEFCREDILQEFSWWQNKMGNSDSKMLIGFYTKLLDTNLPMSDIVVVDENAVVQNIPIQIYGQCGHDTEAYWTFSDGTLTYFGDGIAETMSKPDPVSVNDIKTIIFKDGATGFNGFSEYPCLKNVYIYNRNFDAYFDDPNHIITVFAYKDSSAAEELFSRELQSSLKFMDIETADENYRLLPKYIDEVKIMSDCSYIPQIYAMYDKPVTKLEFAKAVTHALGEINSIDWDAPSDYTDLIAGTAGYGCAIYAVESGWLTPNSDTVFGANDTMTYGEVQKILVEICMEIGGAASEEFYKSNIKLDKNSNEIITYEELSSLLLQAATISDVMPLEFEGSMSTYFEEDRWIAVLTGVLKDGYSGDSETVTDAEYFIYDTDLFGMEDDEIRLLINRHGEVVSGYYTTYNVETGDKTYKADFTINDNAAETESKNVSLKMSAEGYTKYSIDGGTYQTITSSPVSYTLDSKHGEKMISVTFANDDLSQTKTVTKSIILNNLHRVIYQVDGKEFETDMVGCGLAIPALDNTPVKEGYTFVAWDIPEVMPDNDITVNAIFVKNANEEILNSVLTEEEKENGITAKAEITIADENENIQTALINKYSKYTASIILDIEINKFKENDDNFEPINVSQTENLLAFTVDIPEKIKGKAEYIVLREHNGTVDALTTRKNTDGEYIEIKDNTIIINAKKFSAYQLIAKDAEPMPSHRGGSGGGSSIFTVKFETNGAPEIKPVSVNGNSTVTVPATPTKDGFVFDGWYSDKEFKTKFDFLSKITKSVTLYAKWIENTKTSIILTIGQRDAVIDGKTVSNDVAPKIVNNRTMLPIRFIAEALGANVEWDGDSQTVKITAENTDISLVIGENFATVNGEKIELDSPSFIENDRTYLPIRFVSEKLGADVEWDDTEKTVTITK